jgi:hypothetical protein
VSRVICDTYCDFPRNDPIYFGERSSVQASGMRTSCVECAVIRTLLRNAFDHAEVPDYTFVADWPDKIAKSIKISVNARPFPLRDRRSGGGNFFWGFPAL